MRGACAVGAVASLLALAPAGAQTGTFVGRDVVVEASRQVTTAADPSRLFTNPAVAVHPDDPRTIVVAVADARNGGCGLRVTRDGGLSWADTAPTVMPDDLPYCIQRNHGQAVSLAFASDGTLYMGMSGSSYETNPPHPNGPITPLVARTTDLGVTHETFVITEPATGTYTLADGTQAEGVEQHKFSSVAVDPNDPDRVYRGWRMAVRGVEQSPVPGFALGGPDQAIPTQALVATSGDGGRTWSEPFDLTTVFPGEPEGADIPTLAVGPDGTVYAFAEEGGGPRLLMASSTDNGRTWVGAEVNKGANRLGTPIPAVDQSSGDIYLTYEFQGESRDNPADIYFTASTDGGQTWSPPVDISDDDPGRQISQYQPGIGVAPDGRIDVAWHDFRDDPFFTRTDTELHGAVGERYSDVYYTFSTDGGETWAENVRVTDRSIDRSVGVTFNNQDVRSPLAVGSTVDATLLAWPDSRAGDADFEVEDTYFTRVRHDTPALVGDSGGDPLAVPLVLGVGLGLAVAGVALLVTRYLGAGARAGSGTGSARPART